MSSKAVREIQKRLQGMADKDRANQTARYFKTGPGEYGEGDRFIGIRMPDLRRLAKEYRDIPVVDAFELLESLWHEQRMFALIVLSNRFDGAHKTECREIYDGYLSRVAFINNWDLVDSSAHHIVGAYLEGRSHRPLFRLAKSKDLWERRIAIIATFRFIRDEQFDTALDVAEKLLQDDEDLIHKAVGWMLREIGNRDRTVEEGFLKQHYATMPRTMLRYAIERFPERTRQRYLKGSI